MTEQKRHALAVMRAPARLREGGRHVYLLQLRALLSLLGEGHRVRGNDAAQGGAVVEGFQGVAGEDAVRDQCDDGGSAVFAQGVGGLGEGAASV